MVHTDVVAMCATEEFSTACAVYIHVRIEDCEGRV